MKRVNPLGRGRSGLQVFFHRVANLHFLTLVLAVLFSCILALAVWAQTAQIE